MFNYEALYRFNAVISNLSLVVATLGLISDATASHDTSGEHVAVKLLLGSEAQDIEGVLGVEELLVVIDGVDLGLSLGDVDVVIDVGADEALCAKAALANSITCSINENMLSPTTL